MPTITRLSNVSNVSPGGSGLVDVPVGAFTYLTIGCSFAGMVEGDLTNIQVKINNSVVVHWRTLKDLRDYNIHIGSPDQETDEFMLYFAAPRSLFPFPADQNLTALGTAGLSSLQITYDVGSGATAPALNWYAERTGEIRKPGMLHYVQPYNYNVATNKTSLDTFPKSSNKNAFPSITMLAMRPDAGTITEAYFLGNNHEYIEQQTLLFQEAAQRKAGRVDVTGWHYMDFVTSNKPLSALPTLTLNDMRVVVSNSEATSVQFYYHALGVLGSM